MMHGHEKSDPAIVAVKPTNNAELSAAELVEPRAGTKGNAAQQARAGLRVGHTCHRRWTVIRQALPLDPRWEKLWGGRRRLWHLHRPYEPMEVAPWSKSMISAEA